jgi:hypothetical protein
MILVYQPGLILSQNQRYVSFVGHSSKILNFVLGWNRELVDENHTILAPSWHKRKNTYPFDEVSVSFSVRSIKDLNLGPSD